MSHTEIEFLMGRRSIHYLTRSQLYLLCSFHLSRLLLCPFTILKFPLKVPHRNRVFNGEEKHTLLDPFTVIPTLQFSPIAVVIMSIHNFKIPPKVPHRNRVFNGEDKHTLLDPFTVIPTLQFSPIAVVIMSIQYFKIPPKSPMLI